MIKANELRIGNLVMADQPIMVNAIAEDGINLTRGAYSDDITIDYDLSLINPIPLTPEILEKAGLKRKDWFNDINYEIGDHLYITSDFGIYYRYWDGEGDRGGFEREFILFPKYVHQLQNAVFVLTGEELVIKELTPA